MPAQDFGMPPWHMWGNQLHITVTATGVPADVDSSQLINIDYGRPETWSWIMWYQVIADTGGGNPGVLQVRFNLTTGIGRTKFTIPDFVFFINGPPLPTPTMSYTTSTVDREGRNLVDIVGQNIILNVTTVLTGGAAPGTQVDLLVGAMFAPKSHIRPEWFEGRFRGGENEGK